MFYEAELTFFKKVIERMRIRSVIITESNVPDTVDLGIRKFLKLESDYKELFNTDIIPENRNVIIKVIDPFLCNYAFVPLPDAEEKSVLVIGPYVKQLISNEDIRKKATEYGISQNLVKQLEKYFNSVLYLPDDGNLLTLINCFGEVVFGSLENFSVSTKSIDDISDTSFLTRISNSDKTDDPWLTVQLIERKYEAENALLNAVSQGLLHKAEMFFVNIVPSKVLETRHPDPLRNAKNFMIILNTLLRKAAEQGSVQPVYIDEVSSSLAAKIEATGSLEECDELFRYMVRKYCRLVNKHSQKGYSLLVQKIITRIDTDLTADLSLKESARLLNVNPSYLSNLFKKETGVTLTDYVNQKRVERAKQLLHTTNMQIQAVAQSCGILDVNYFTKMFKKYSGKTPNEYRKS